MEYSVVINGREVTSVSGDEAAWARFSKACEAVQIQNECYAKSHSWVELRLMNGEPVARFDENGMNT